MKKAISQPSAFLSIDRYVSTNTLFKLPENVYTKRETYEELCFCETTESLKIALKELQESKFRQGE